MENDDTIHDADGSVFQQLSPIIDAIAKGDLDQLTQLLDATPSAVNAYHQLLFTPVRGHIRSPNL